MGVVVSWPWLAALLCSTVLPRAWLAHTATVSANKMVTSFTTLCSFFLCYGRDW
jgi:hypothetical protein